MNGQPPPPASPPIQPAPQYYPPRRSGMGCFGGCCLGLLILGFLCIAGVLGTGWYVYHKLASNNIISDAPITVQVEQPTEAQYQAAESSLAKLKAATNERREETISFSATDLNALLARDPDFHDLAGRAGVEIANSTMTINLSAPLDVLWSSKKRRWFNGIVRFTGRFENGEFQIDIQSARGGEYDVPDYILSRVNNNISRALSDNVDDWRHDAGVDLRRVKRMSLEGDKLVITTKAE
jgi:hypothetical protein